jgi:hypothetical protein
MILEKLISYFFDDFRLRRPALWFKRLLYCFLLVKTIYWFIYYDLLFGTDSIVYKTPSSFGSFRDLAFLLYNSSSEHLTFAFLAGFFALSVLNLFYGKIYFITDFLLWFMFLNVSNCIYPTMTSGDFLLQQLLLFNCFLVNHPASEIKTRTHSLKLFFHNTGLLCIIIQVCLVYAISALSKLGDETWMRGEAVSDISKIHSFSLYSFLTYQPELELTFICLNYIVLTYQLLFPFVIWIPRIKKYVLIIGIMMHVYIALVMGLVEFGLVMLLSYTLFWPVKREVV